ncbi:MAG: tRNA (guanosine(37)-N1)-methyltransferase TrmD [Candidatus Nitrospinota bacterium M3_3B_026]
MPRFDIVTIFPGMFDGVFDHSIIGRAKEKGIVEINVHDLRGWTRDKHKVTDDYPYGGGAGMVMKAPPFAGAVESLRAENPGAKVVLMTPQGRLLTQKTAEEFSVLPGLVILCGRYEGVDERVRSLVDMEISIGDFILTGGEIPAMALVDAVARLAPGVVGEAESIVRESHTGGLLEYPQYTRPAEFAGMRVPDVLLSGDHAKIEAWRRRQSIIRTARRRPDLLERAELTEEERRLAEKEIEAGRGGVE